MAVSTSCWRCVGDRRSEISRKSANILSRFAEDDAIYFFAYLVQHMIRNWYLRNAVAVLTSLGRSRKRKDLIGVLSTIVTVK